MINIQSDKQLTFDEFYRKYYLRNHRERLNRIIHYLGGTFMIISIISSFLTGLSPIGLLYFLPTVQFIYGFIGHYMVEQNEFAYIQTQNNEVFDFIGPRRSFPLMYVYGFMGDFKFWFDVTMGNQRL
ncbi:hypothetical protein PPERSA_02534 [Pseudocohnilembus persalinus]|uniref:DUF962 domain-containing protein n=1 Tax=Pseudocohnilembus persalinus TaxID=266149 RepID=A0A0V0R5B3_PSEPJ|nr:hypothetical protein PPERSA_02534 [Pseudocohnilembus persalinus]|eukprot:KRX09662.1 hypothetical protein PPERSA_02534 [Pseudocohnilembus persalinus]